MQHNTTLIPNTKGKMLGVVIFIEPQFMENLVKNFLLLSSDYESQTQNFITNQVIILKNRDKNFESGDKLR